MSRTASHTKNSVDHEFGEEEETLAKQAVEILGQEKIISLDTAVGDGREGVTARFIIPQKYTHLAYGLKLLLDCSPTGIVEDPTYTIVTRKNLEIASNGLCGNKIDYIVILTRNPLVNVVCKLTPEQATMQFMYGESIESTGGDPEQAGRFKRIFFLDPFVVGNRLEHAMIFYDILKQNNIECYLANTGTIGETEEEVSLRQSLSAYNDLLRRQLRFSVEPDHLVYHYPIKCDRANMDLMNAYHLFDDKTLLKKRVIDFLKGRQQYLEEFEEKYGRIPEHIWESLPYKYKKIPLVERIEGE